MFLNSDMAEAVIDWLERDTIQHALMAARPALRDMVILEDDRPMIRIPHQDGGSILVAKTAEGTMTQWIVGIPGRPEPYLHEPDTPDEIVRIVLDELDGTPDRTHRSPIPEGR